MYCMYVCMYVCQAGIDVNLWFELIGHIMNKPLPEASENKEPLNQPTEYEERKKWPWWKVHTLIHTYTSLHPYVHTYKYTYIHTYTRMNILTYIHIHTYIHTYTSLPAYIHMNIHAYIHT